ncbi:nicotinamide-nucleotide amidohydrolase family protein, partial [Hydrogenophaga sp.]|uniref:nicotinamide-nucleotide amidohydrolase family protein n=1 Tax=Hydrogenophaga sp. TaxID=1904254 RepID=UPI002720F4A2
RGIPPVRLRCTGITESDAQALVEPAIAPYPDVEFTILAAPGDVEVVLFADAQDTGSLDRARHAAREALGDVCYSADGSSLAETVIGLARAGGVQLACAESCTGGLVAAALTDVAGASDVFGGGVVAYADEAKLHLLHVPAELLSAHGAVSEAVARAMAEGALPVAGATLAVATTGIAGPGGATADKPVGLVWFAVARRGTETLTTERCFRGDRERVRDQATATALDLLRRELQGV